MLCFLIVSLWFSSEIALIEVEDRVTASGGASRPGRRYVV